MIQGHTVRIRQDPFTDWPQSRARQVAQTHRRSRSPPRQSMIHRSSPAPSRYSGSSSCRSDASGASFTSAANVGGRCYLKGTLFKDMNERFVPVEHLQQFDVISDSNMQPTRIRKIVELTGPHEVVTITAGDASLS